MQEIQAREGIQARSDRTSTGSPSIQASMFHCKADAANYIEKPSYVSSGCRLPVEALASNAGFPG